MGNPESSVLIGPRPWAFTIAELTAGLRRMLKDPDLHVKDIIARDIPHQRSSLSRVRGMKVVCQGSGGEKIYDMVVKEGFGATRTGAANAGWRERSLYSTLMDYIPIKMPSLVAADPDGDWIILKLLPGGKPAEHWKVAEYILAIDHLASLHDQFWGLSEDLLNYNWLARPIDADFYLIVNAVTNSLQKMGDLSNNLLYREPGFFSTINNLVAQAEHIVRPLRQVPATLLHGDYWPGNLMAYPDGTLYAIDWQMASIGPCILDLIYFLQESRWWFEPLPISISEMIKRYRANITKSRGIEWTVNEWEMLLDHALLWIFVSNWIEVLIKTPDSLIKTQHERLETVWLEPIRRAAFRRLARS